MNHEIVSEAAFYDHVEVLIRNARSDVKQQIEDIKALSEEDIDLLMISPLEDTTFIEVLNQLDLTDVPVLLVDREISSNKYVSFVGASNCEVGVRAADYVRQLRGNEPTDIFLIRGYDKSTATFDRESGFVNALRPLENFRIHTVVAGKDNDGQMVEQTKAILQRELPLLKRCDVVYAFNDAMALAAYRVLKKANVTRMPIIIGVDGMLGYMKGINAVKDGMLTASIVYPTGGRKAIEVGMDIINHKSVAKENLLPITLVDKHNVDTYYEQEIKITEMQQKIELLLANKLKAEMRLRGLLAGLGLGGVLLLAAVGYGIWYWHRKRIVGVEDCIDGAVVLERDEDLDSDFKNRVLACAEAHYMEFDFDLSAVISEFRMSRVAFYRKFKKNLNDTPSNYLKVYRLKKSKELILRNEFTYAEIGYKVGFSSPSYYTKCFKDEYGETPSQYFERKSRKKNK